MAEKSKQKRSYPPFYEKLVPIAVGIISLMTIIMIAFAISLIIS
jgi:hypothetical protein